MCSVLFADLVGFTPLSEARDPEEVRELLSRYFDTAHTVIGRYGGVVEKFIGDAVMAVWGTPVAAEGDAERAVRAGLDLVAAVAALGGEVGAEGLALRAGVVTGEVAASIGSVGEGMVAGDAVNTAARVQSVAEPGTVWVDAATHRLAAAGVGFRHAGDHALKGKAEPVSLWQATRVHSSVGGAQRVDGLEAPMIGREAEDRTLRELLHATIERRVPRLVTVTGAAGSGKSRLGWEFEKYVDGLAEVVWWHRGRCLSYGDGVAFWALAEAVRQRFGIAAEEPVGDATAKFLTGLGRHVTAEQERSFVGVRVGRLLGLTHPDDAGLALGQDDLFAGWRLLLERLSDTGPVVVLIEDAQHADDALLDFVEHVLAWARQAPIYLVLLGRSELLERRPSLAGGRNRTSLPLDALDDRSMRALVGALVAGMPEHAVTSIVAQAQGNPLFAVETVRSLIDRDVIVPVEGEYRLVADIGALSVPDSLHGLLAARLDTLEPGLRALVADAAVLGTSFPAGALAAVFGRDETAVSVALGELVRREVFDVSTDPLSPERGSYLFAQNMLRQVAYDTLSRRDRRARHLAVAEHLQNVFTAGGDEVMDVIAAHYLDALNALADEHDPAIRAKALDSLTRAAERSERSGA
ncbi:MAG: AAA family ATPase, partial [Actinomycetota bacterium]|nr:AAA family ATPase [Actinomycetota bacterium]